MILAGVTILGKASTNFVEQGVTIKSKYYNNYVLGVVLKKMHEISDGV